MAGELINCRACGTLFKKKLRDLCELCVEKEKMKLQIIVDFIRDYPDNFVPIEIIASSNGLTVPMVEQMYKMGQLAGVASRISIKCKSCGKQVNFNKQGHFCEDCSKKYTKDKIVREKLKEARKEARAQIKKQREEDEKKTIAAQAILKKEKYGFQRPFDEDFDFS